MITKVYVHLADQHQHLADAVNKINAGSKPAPADPVSARKRAWPVNPKKPGPKPKGQGGDFGDAEYSQPRVQVGALDPDGPPRPAASHPRVGEAAFGAPDVDQRLADGRPVGGLPELD